MSEQLRIITWAELSKRVPYVRQHVSRLERAGQFPRRVRLGQGRGRIGWLEHEINAWILERAKTSRIDLAERGSPSARPHPNR